MSNIQVEIVQCHIVRELVVYVEKLGQRLISEGRNEMKSDHRFSDFYLYEEYCYLVFKGLSQETPKDRNFYTCK